MLRGAEDFQHPGAPREELRLHVHLPRPGTLRHLVRALSLALAFSLSLLPPLLMSILG